MSYVRLFQGKINIIYIFRHIAKHTQKKPKTLTKMKMENINIKTVSKH